MTKTFNDVKKELFNENPGLATALETIGKIMAKRHELNLTQKQLSELSGVSPTTITRMESGAAVPRGATLAKLLFVIKEYESERESKIKENNSI